jgi:putative flippase GtrA
LFTGTTDNVVVQFCRYTLVGGVALVVDFGALWLLKELAGWHYLWAAALAFILGVVTNYAISVTWVFGRRAVEDRRLEFVIFALLGVLGLGINELLMLTLTQIGGLHYLVSKGVSTGVTFVWNFGSRKALLFSLARRDTRGEGLLLQRRTPPDSLRPAAEVAPVRPLRTELANELA